ncbi:MAG: nucleotidyltransferase family protein [Candidatus Wallbacteria bacterium]|nr:nucleotidyltransferase family protein [Candidatus Wallbacteria bacterium]
MNFKELLSQLAFALGSQKVDYALIGGVSLGFWGVNRSTLDLDFLINSDDLGKAESILYDLKYKSFYKTEEVAQYLPEAGGVAVDILIARRKYTLEMLKQSEIHHVSGFSLKVLRPEGIIGLKLQAMGNAPEREALELCDIESLLKSNPGLDWNQLKEYFLLFKREDLFQELKAKYEADR